MAATYQQCHSSSKEEPLPRAEVDQPSSMLPTLEINHGCIDWFMGEGGSDRMPFPSPPYIDGNPYLDQDDLWTQLLPRSPFLMQQEDGHADIFRTNAEMTQSPYGSYDSSHPETATHSINLGQQSGATDQLVDAQDPTSDGKSPGVLDLAIDVALTSPHSPAQADSFEEPEESHARLEGSKRSRPATPAFDSAAERSSRKKAKMSPQSVLDEMDRGRAEPWTVDRSFERNNEQRKVKNGGTQQISRSEMERTSACNPGATPGTGRGKSSQNTQASKESRWAEQLLSACATAIASNNMIRTQHLMWVLNDLASLSGDANHRLAAYGLKALFSRVTGSTDLAISPSLSAESSSRVGARPVHRALLRFLEASPWQQMVYTIANDALLEACEDHKVVHIVDIGVSQGTQWPTFIEALATRSSGAPNLLRLTTVRDPGAALVSGGGLHIGASSSDFLARLEPFASTMGLKLELQTVSVPLESLKREDLRLKEGEALAICCQFRLHQLNEELKSTELGVEAGTKSTEEQQLALSARDAFLKRMHDLDPEVFVLSENDTDQCATDFLERFQKVMDFHWRFLDSMGASFKGRDCEERQIIEQEATVAMMNNVRFDGEARIERNEGHVTWSSRMEKAGFFSDLPKEEVVENAKALLRKYDPNWDLWVDDPSMVLRWKGHPVTFCSIWKS